MSVFRGLRNADRAAVLQTAAIIIGCLPERKTSAGNPSTGVHLRGIPADAPPLDTSKWAISRPAEFHPATGHV